MQPIASFNLVSNGMPYKMGFYENKKGKSIGSESPSKVVFPIKYREFFKFDIYRFVGTKEIDKET